MLGSAKFWFSLNSAQGPEVFPGSLSSKNQRHRSTAVTLTAPPAPAGWGARWGIDTKKTHSRPLAPIEAPGQAHIFKLRCKGHGGHPWGEVSPPLPSLPQHLTLHLSSCPFPQHIHPGPPGPQLPGHPAALHGALSSPHNPSTTRVTTS